MNNIEKNTGNSQTQILIKKKTLKRFAILIFIMIIATPLGLLAIGTAYGEWGSDDLLEMLGYVPSGIAQGESFWNSLFPDYTVGNLNENLGYWLSAIIGVILVIIAISIIGKVVARKEDQLNGNT